MNANNLPIVATVPIVKRKSRYVKPFRILYFYWGHGRRTRGDKTGSAWELQEAYGNASRHLGRGSVYFRAVIIDNENLKVIAVLTRYMNRIDIKEL